MKPGRLVKSEGNNPEEEEEEMAAGSSSNQLKSDQDCCSICLDSLDQKMNQTETVDLHPCKHIFHRPCIIGWLTQAEQKRCPLCRVLSDYMVSIVHGNRIAIPRRSVRSVRDIMNEWTEDGVFDETDVSDFIIPFDFEQAPRRFCEVCNEERPGQALMACDLCHEMRVHRRCCRSDTYVCMDCMDQAQQQSASRTRSGRIIQPRIPVRLIVEDDEIFDHEDDTPEPDDIPEPEMADINTFAQPHHSRAASVSSDEEDEEEEEEEEFEGDSDSDDDHILNDDPDQPGPSRAIMPPVRRQRKKKRTGRVTKKKRAGSKNTPKRTKRRKTKTKKRRTKGTRASSSTLNSSLSFSSIPRYLRPPVPSLSLNGADMEPLEEEEDTPVRNNPLMETRSVSHTSSSNEPDDLLGSLLINQTATLAPGRHFKQENGRLVPRESYHNHVERVERRINPTLSKATGPILREHRDSLMPSSDRIPTASNETHGSSRMPYRNSTSSSSSPMISSPPNEHNVPHPISHHTIPQSSMYPPTVYSSLSNFPVCTPSASHVVSVPPPPPPPGPPPPNARRLPPPPPPPRTVPPITHIPNAFSSNAHRTSSSSTSRGVFATDVFGLEEALNNLHSKENDDERKKRKAARIAKIEAVAKSELKKPVQTKQITSDQYKKILKNVVKMSCERKYEKQQIKSAVASLIEKELRN